MSFIFTKRSGTYTQIKYRIRAINSRPCLIKRPQEKFELAPPPIVPFKRFCTKIGEKLDIT